MFRAVDTNNISTLHSLNHTIKSIVYLRISVTDRCNLRCLYCSPYNNIPKLSHHDILTHEEIYKIVTLACSIGIRKIRITGGEPLIRKGLLGLINRLKGIDHLKDLSMTTNGILLPKYVGNLVASGIKRINISLDSLKPKKFYQITGYDKLHNVLEGIKMATDLGLHPIKINMVVIKGINDDEVQDFARLTFDHPYQIRFIEYMPVGIQPQKIHLSHLPNKIIKKRLDRIAKLNKLPEVGYAGPADCYKFEGSRGEIGFISPRSHAFCSKCNRLRLTANGYLRPCLFSDAQLDLKNPLRDGASDEELLSIFKRAILDKPVKAQPFSNNNNKQNNWYMSSIGG